MVFGIGLVGVRIKGLDVDLQSVACWVEAINEDEANGIAARLARQIFPLSKWARHTWSVGSVELDPIRIEECHLTHNAR